MGGGDQREGLHTRWDCGSLGGPGVVQECVQGRETAGPDCLPVPCGREGHPVPHAADRTHSCPHRLSAAAVFELSPIYGRIFPRHLCLSMLIGSTALSAL